MDRVFVCADLHFSHANIIQYCNRPFRSAEEMDQEIVQRWNKAVRKNDHVFVLGDVSLGSRERTHELVHQLHGRKILIMGNHDRGRSVATWLDIGFDVVIPYPILYQNQVLLMHEPPEAIPDTSPYFHIYGHVHTSPDYADHTTCSACVSLERINYTPALLDDVISGKAYTQQR